MKIYGESFYVFNLEVARFEVEIQILYHITVSEKINNR